MNKTIFFLVLFFLCTPWIYAQNTAYYTQAGLEDLFVKSGSSADVVDNNNNKFYAPNGIETVKTPINLGTIAALSGETIATFPTGTQGDIMYHNGSDWVVLNAGTADQRLKTQGSSSNPVWADTNLNDIDDTNISTAIGTIAYRDVSGNLVGLPIGTSSEILTVNAAGTMPEWDAISSTSSPFLPSGVQGDIMYHNGSDWVVRNAGTDGDSLISKGASANPVWENVSTPSGAISIFAGAVAPTGYFLCDGSAISRTSYSDLFSIISTTYGVGDGSTTFNIPDLRDQFVTGAGVSYSVADSGGANSVTLTAAQSGLPAHTHTYDKITYTTTIYGGTGTYPEITGFASTNTSSTGGTAASSSHENRPPYTALNYIIKY